MNAIYSSAFPLLLLLLPAVVGNPLPTAEPEGYEQMRDLAKSLLNNAKHLPKSEALTYGIKTEKVALGNNKTLLACTPNLEPNQGCISRSGPFSEYECLTAIMEDLDEYEDTFLSYLQANIARQEEAKADLKPTLDIIRSLKKKLSLMLDGRSDSLEHATKKWDTDSFNNRYEMIKIVNGFIMRVGFYNRVFSYICAGDHRK